MYAREENGFLMRWKNTISPRRFEGKGVESGTGRREGGIESLTGNLSKTTTELAARACKIGLFNKMVKYGKRKTKNIG